MQPLPTHFTDRTFTYEQIDREGDLAIFTQTHRLSGVVRYEVVRIRVAPAHTWPNGTTSPERETYPGSHSWGASGWTAFSLGEAKGSPEINHETILCMVKANASGDGNIDACVASPPYAESAIAHTEGNISGQPGGRKASALTNVNGNIKKVGYGTTEGQLGAMAEGATP